MLSGERSHRGASLRQRGPACRRHRGNPRGTGWSQSSGWHRAESAGARQSRHVFVVFEKFDSHQTARQGRRRGTSQRLHQRHLREKAHFGSGEILDPTMDLWRILRAKENFSRDMWRWYLVSFTQVLPVLQVLAALNEFLLKSLRLSSLSSFLFDSRILWLKFLYRYFLNRDYHWWHTDNAINKFCDLCHLFPSQCCNLDFASLDDYFPYL